MYNTFIFFFLWANSTGGSVGLNLFLTLTQLMPNWSINLLETLIKVAVCLFHQWSCFAFWSTPHSCIVCSRTAGGGVLTCLPPPALTERGRSLQPAEGWLIRRWEAPSSPADRIARIKWLTAGKTPAKADRKHINKPWELRVMQVEMMAVLKLPWKQRTRKPLLFLTDSLVTEKGSWFSKSILKWLLI